MQHTRILFIFCQILFANLFFTPSLQAQHVYQSQLGPVDGQFQYPTRVAVDGLGNIYIADRENDRIQKFSSSGLFISKFGSQGSGNGQFRDPYDLTVDVQGNIYVVDQDNYRIQKFSSSGVFLSKFGSQGNGDGQFKQATGITVDEQGNIYVADQVNQHIQKFSSSGIFLSKFGSQGSEDGQFEILSDITVDGQGNIYVADQGNHRIQKFSSSGIFLSKFGSKGSGDGQFSSPTDITVDGQNNVYVADKVNHRIQKFSSSEVFLSKFGSYGIANGQFQYPSSVSVDAQGNIYVADQGNQRIQYFSFSEVFISTFSFYSMADGQVHVPSGLAVDVQGNIYVVDRGNHRIQKFSSSGIFLSKFGSQGNGDGQFSAPVDVAVDGQGNIYVADQYNHRIQKFSASGVFISKFGSFGLANGQFEDPYGLAVDGQGNVYVAEQNNHRVQKFSSSGVFISKFGSKGSGDGQLQYPYGITIDGQGNIYVADQGNQRIQKFSSSGVFISKFGSQGSGIRYFLNPNDLAVDGQDNVYVVDQGNHRIQKFSSSGVFLEEFGSQGTENGQFSSPTGITIDQLNNVYVAELSNNRIQKFIDCSSIVLTSTLLPSGTVGSSYSATITGAPVGFTYSVTGLPAGLNMSSTGVISGTPTIAITAPNSIRVTITNGICSKSVDYSLTINKGTAIVSITNTTQKYDGTAKAVTVNTTPTGLTIDVSYNDASIKPIDAGTYTVVATINSSDYTGTTIDTLIINQAPLTIIADNVSKAYGEANPALSLTYAGFVNGETKSIIDFLPVVSTSAMQTSNIGTYPITLFGGSDNNYALVLQNGIMTITKANQNITFDSLEVKTFGDAPFILFATASSGLLPYFTIVSGPATLSDTILTITSIGIITVKTNQAGNTNYEAAPEVTQSFCVLPAKPVITSSEAILSSSISGGNQWYLNGESIAGAIAQTYQATVSGSYTVAVTGPCGAEVISKTFDIIIAAVEPAFASEVVFYPNPASDQIIMQLPAGINYQGFRLFDINGKQAASIATKNKTKVIFAIHQLSKGFYLLEVETSSGIIHKKLLVQ